MAKIIGYSPSIVQNPDVQTPKGPLDDYQRIQTDTGQFGGLQGAAEQQAGARIEQGSNELGQAALNIQGVKNTTDANAGTDQYVKAVNTILRGDGTDANKGLFNLRGREALDALPAATAEMEKAYNDIGNTLTNPVARNTYNQEARRYYMGHTDEVFRFGLEAQKQYAEETNNSLIASAHTSSSLNYSNDQIAESDIDRATNGLVQNEQLKYGIVPDDRRASLRQHAVTTNIEARVNGAVARGDYTTAHSILDKYGPQADPLKFRELNDTVKREEYEAQTRGRTQDGKELSDQIINYWMNGGPLPSYKGAPVPGGKGGSSALQSAIYGQEGSGPNSVSIQGASGQSQILEGTFNEHKQAGESYSNEKDRMAVSGRLIDDYSQRYNGDASRVAVAYFSGPGNVAPPGSPTPWISDKKDGNGFPTSSYVGGVLSRLGTSGASQQPEQEQGSPNETSPVKFRGVGDSIAAGAIQHGVQGSWGKSPAETEKDAAVSRKPQQVLDFINSRPEHYFAGQDILLSTGVSNQPGQINLVPQEIDALKKAGAKSVTVLGLGKRADLLPLNDNLREMANAGGAAFSGPLKGTEKDSELVHPVGSYPQMVQQAQQAYQTYRQSTAAIPSPPAGAGDAAAISGTGAPTGPITGLLDKGNIDLAKRPVVNNPDGSISTVRSMSFEQDGKEVLIPTVAADGSGILSDQQAIDQYKKTGQFLGKFDTPENATAYAEKLHEAQAQAYASPDTVAGERVPQPAGQQAPNNSVPFPSKEQMINMIPPNAPLEVRHAAMARIDQAFAEMNARSFEERRKMERWIPGVAAKLADGQNDASTVYDPNTIRHYLPPDQAEKALDGLDQAKQIGQYATQIRTMTPTQIQDISDKLHHDLDANPNPDLYIKNKQIVEHFDAAAKAQLGQLMGKDADPAGYLRRIDPMLDAKAKSLDFNNPASIDEYATAMGARQTQMGVPKSMQHIVTTTQAQDITHSITADPAKSAEVMKQMQQQWGDHWNDVFADAVTQGKLPAAYQVVQHLEDIGDPHNAALLARGMGGAVKESGAKAKEFWDDTIGSKAMGDIKTNLLGNTTMQSFVHSLMASNAPQDQIDSMIQAVHTLAYSKQAYEQSADPASDAVKAVLGKYDFLTEYGGARVPAAVAPTVRTNIGVVLDRLDPSALELPKLTNGVTPEQWVAMIKAHPTFVTTPREDGVRLLDKDGRLVKNKAGDAVEIPFNAAAWGQPRVVESPPMSGL